MTGSGLLIDSGMAITMVLVALVAAGTGVAPGTGVEPATDWEAGGVGLHASSSPPVTATRPAAATPVRNCRRDNRRPAREMMFCSADFFWSILLPLYSTSSTPGSPVRR